MGLAMWQTVYFSFILVVLFCSENLADLHVWVNCTNYTVKIKWFWGCFIFLTFERKNKNIWLCTNHSFEKKLKWHRQHLQIIDDFQYVLSFCRARDNNASAHENVYVKLCRALFDELLEIGSDLEWALHYLSSLFAVTQTQACAHPQNLRFEVWSLHCCAVQNFGKLLHFNISKF